MEIFDKYTEEKLEKLEEQIKAGLRKLANETTLSWEELVSQLGIDIHPDEFRKRAYGYQEYDYINRQRLTSIATQEEIETLNERIAKLQIEKTKVSDMKIYVNKKLREISRNENLFELANDLVNAMENHYPLISPDEYIGTTVGANEGILMLSDWHIGMEIENSWNVFNTNILYKRIDYLVERTVESCFANGVKKLHLVFIGDIISGLIHSTIRIENREDVIKQTLIASEVISEMIQYLSRYFEIDVHFSVGNHDRVTPNKTDSLDNESFGYLIRQMVMLRTKSLIKPITYTDNKIDEELITFDCLGWKMVATHGDKFGKKTDMISKITSMLKYVPDYVLMGHLHQHYESTTGETELIINPSLSGVDTYAKNLGFTGRPAQKLLIMNEKIGKLCTYNIYLDKIEDKLAI